MKTYKSILSISLGILLLGTLFTSCSKEEGCTDPKANNFNTTAQKDDGSCTYDAVTPTATVVEKSNIVINFTHNFDGLPISASNFNQFNYVNANGDTLSITKIRYLISDIKLYTYSGDSIVLDGYQLVDVTNGTGLSYFPGEVNWGAYAAIGFNFGFDTTDNMGNYTDLNSASWNWPMMIGGGYHNLQFEGRFKTGGSDSPFAYHMGTASSGGNHEQNHIAVRLPNIALNERNVAIEIQMNLAEWFKNPINWDLNTYSIMLMPNYTAQKMMQDNGFNVFNLGAVSQKQ